MTKGFLFFASTVLLIAACTTSKAPTSPTSAEQASSVALAHLGHGATSADGSAGNPNSGAHDDRGYIDGWLNGEDVQLYYTKSFFCDPVPPSGIAPCEIGAPPDTTPRPGPIPTIYAIAAGPLIKDLVDPKTLSCRFGTPCLNHPSMIDLFRIGGSSTAPPASHSHILTSRGAGWFHTVNIRVFSVDAWGQIAAAKTLDKVRELQGDPHLGTPGVISGDTPTNIYFFIAGEHPPDVE